MGAIAAYITVNLEESTRPEFRWADRFDFPDERIISLDRHALQAVAESEKRYRGIRLHIGPKAIRESVGARWLNKPDRFRRRKPQSVEISISKVSVAFFLRCLLERELGKIPSPRCFEPLGGSTEQARCLPGKNVVARQPT